MPDTAMPLAGMPPAGWWEGRSHVLPIRVYYEDTDAGGIVYHANYLRFAERARNEMLRLAGFPHATMVAETGTALTVRHCDIDFRQPARLDDALVIVTRIVDIGAATLDIEQDVCRVSGLAWGGVAAATGPQALVRMGLRLACINAQGRPVRLPAALRAVLVTGLPSVDRDADGISHELSTQGQD